MMEAPKELRCGLFVSLEAPLAIAIRRACDIRDVLSKVLEIHRCDGSGCKSEIQRRLERCWKSALSMCLLRK